MMSPGNMIIGLSGPARSGKDTAGYYLADQYGFDTLALADPIKRGLAAMLDLTDDQLNGSGKEFVDPVLGYSPRQLCQMLGTDWGRVMVRDDLWILVASSRIEQRKRSPFFLGLVVTDIRLENEAAWLRSIGGQVVHIRRTDREAVNPHVTEDGIEYREGDIQISNDGTLEDLYCRLDDIVGDLSGEVEFVGGA